MLCTNCGLALQGNDEAALFVCANCGLVHEPTEEGLVASSPLTATQTTELAVAGPVRYLAVWQVDVKVCGTQDSAWERIRRVTAPHPAYLYVPAFSLMRAVLHRLGASLTLTQPELTLTKGLVTGGSRRPALVGAGGRDLGVAPDFGPISPIMVGRHDARTLAHFVYLAVESHENQELTAVDYELEALGEDLLFVPAVWDPRCIHESNWRLLLREYDGQVA